MFLSRLVVWEARRRHAAWRSMGLLLAGSVSMMVPALQAQTLDDAIFMDRRILCAGLMYSRDQWSQYWEGARRRDNGNIGTLTTQMSSVMGAYGVTDRINILASLPYVSTTASQGVLAGQSGAQDLTVGVKFNALSTPLTSAGTLHVIGVVSAATPVSSYTPDFLPLSIGTQSRRATARGLLSFQAKNGLYVNTSVAYTRRGNVTLNRPAYFTNGQLFLTNEVEMPDVTDAMFTIGYQRKGLVVPVTLTRQRTLGGGDIRRQDMPFVSNRMDFTRLDGRVQYTLPKLRAATIHLGASHVLTGRNVGQSTAVMAGLLLVGKL
jgi:hypothetical protein